MSIANLTKWYVHINKFGLAAGRVVGSKDLCDPSLKYEVLVKFEEAVEASSNSLQQLKAEICHCVDETPQYAIKKLIEMGHPFCSRCGGKLSAV